MKKIIVTAKLPTSSTAAFKEILRIIDLGWIDVPREKSYGGTGAPGRLLENLLGIKENNKDSPDLFDWEIKYHGGGTLITLFHKDPEPRGIIRNLVHEHGWPDESSRTSFRHTISGKSDRGFYVVNEKDRIVVRHNSKDTVVPFWRHNILMSTFAAKLRRLILVEGEYNKVKRQVRYNSATAFWNVNITGFADAVEKGIVRIDFDARTNENGGKGIRNHGTKFRIDANDLHTLYEHQKLITKP